MEQPSWEDIDLMDKLLRIKLGPQNSTHRGDDFETLMGFSIHDSDKCQYYENLLIEFNRNNCGGKLGIIMDEFTDYESVEIRGPSKIYADNFIKKYGSIRGYYQPSSSVENKMKTITEIIDDLMPALLTHYPGGFRPNDFFCDKDYQVLRDPAIDKAIKLDLIEWMGTLIKLSTFGYEVASEYGAYSKYLKEKSKLEILTINKPIDTTPHKSMNGNIFIIHGHDEAKLLELKAILKDDFNLTPFILRDLPNNGSPTLIEKFEFYAPKCSFAIAMFTPDDVVENKGKKYVQARPNVIYELGWFCARLSRKNVIMILKEGTDIFSDFQGILQMRFANDVAELHTKLLEEFKAVGLIK